MYYIMSNYTFYKIVCKDESITNCYVGQTTDFIVRYRLHKSKCTNPNSDKYNIKVYEFIRSNGGWDNWEMLEIETCICENDFEARKIERCWIECLGGQLNCLIPNRTDKEYYEENKERITEYKHEWYERNKEHCLEKQKTYAQANKEKKAKRQKAYALANKEKLAKYKKEYYERKKLEKQQNQGN